MPLPAWPSERRGDDTTVTVEHAPAVRLVDVGRVEQVEIPVRDPGPGEVLIRVLGVGLCGSDAHWFREGGIGDLSIPTGGVVPCHEFCGVIETGSRSGERVAIDPAIPCLHCEQCVRGRLNLCLAMRFAGQASTEGGLQEFVVWPERCLVPIPDNVTNEQGALLEPFGVALHALDLGALRAGETVGVIGCGPLGLLVIKALASRGVEAIAAKEPLAHRMSAALDFGAVVWPEEGDGRFDVIFECAGRDESLHESLVAVAPGGRVVLVGIPEHDRSSFQASLARRKEISLRSSRRMMPQDLERAARMAGSGEVSLDGLVTHRFGLSAALAAFQTLVARTGIKVVVEP